MPRLSCDALRFSVPSKARATWSAWRRSSKERSCAIAALRRKQLQKLARAGKTALELGVDAERVERLLVLHLRNRVLDGDHQTRAQDRESGIGEIERFGHNLVERRLGSVALGCLQSGGVQRV